MSTQLTHTETSFKKESFPLILVCDGITSPANVGALFRLCDAMGVEELLFSNTSIDLSSKRLQKTARNTQNHINFSEIDSMDETLNKFSSKGYHIQILEISSKSRPISKWQLDASAKGVVWVIGNEQHGVSNVLLNQVSEHYHIPMYGRNSSMNVVQATAIALYESTKQFN